MAKQNFTYYVKRDQNKKRPGCHKKSQNKSECRQKVRIDIKVKADEKRYSIRWITKNYLHAR